MTLILSCLTSDVVYQVSDRRLTSFIPPHDRIDDESNKAVFVNGRVTFGYTGIAEVNGEKTADWLARAAAGAATMDMARVARAIRDDATACFRRMNFASPIKRHAFQGVGWFAGPGSPFRPGLLTIHNALDSGTGGWLPYARDEFELTSDFYRLSSNQFVLTSVGHTPTAEERAAVYQLIRKCVHRRHGRQRAVVFAMVLAMRWLSAQYGPNSPIGRNLMAVSLPKRAAEQLDETGHSMVLAGPPNPDMASFLDIPEHSRAVRYGPHAVFGDAVILNFETGPNHPATA